MLYDKKWDEKLPASTENFKTAAELGLRNQEYNALLRLLPMFEQGKIPHHLFNMERIGQPECGSAGCIIGWAKTFEHDNFTNDWDTGTLDTRFAITALCSPIWLAATPADATIALRNYLTTGHASWDEVLNKH